MHNPFKPGKAKIVDIKKETMDTTTYTFKFADEEVRGNFSFNPGQFNMLTIFGIGEAPISISSNPENKEYFQHTIRHVGNVTNAMTKLNVGDTLGIRGAYGTGWNVDLLKGKNVLVVAGGIGLAPLRPVILQLANHRKDFGRVEILYGARAPKEMLFTDEYEIWLAKELAILLTVDSVPEGEPWNHRVGVVTDLFAEMNSIPGETIALICGPEIMMEFAVKGLLERQFSPEQIYVSMERHMNCGVKKCGKCQIGPKFVCQDGPVFAFAELLALPENVLGGVEK
jgi:NAD(P)H-flavin reductase